MPFSEQRNSLELQHKRNVIRTCMKRERNVRMCNVCWENCQPHNIHWIFKYESHIDTSTWCATCAIDSLRTLSSADLHHPQNAWRRRWRCRFLSLSSSISVLLSLLAAEDVRRPAFGLQMWNFKWCSIFSHLYMYVCVFLHVSLSACVCESQQ